VRIISDIRPCKDAVSRLFLGCEVQNDKKWECGLILRFGPSVMVMDTPVGSAKKAILPPFSSGTDHRWSIAAATDAQVLVLA